MHKLKELLLDEIYEIEEKAIKMPEEKMSAQDLERIHILTDSVKNICKIGILEEEAGYSESSDWMGEGRLYGTTYARRGRNVKRDRMGRYSRYGDHYEAGAAYDGAPTRDSYSRSSKDHLINRAEEMLKITDGEEERKVIHQFIKNLEAM